MTENIPDEKRFERVREYLAKRREVTPVIDGEQFDTIHDIDSGSSGHIKLFASDIEALVRLVSPVTRGALIARIEREMETYDPDTLGDDPTVFDSWNLLHDARAALIASPPVQVEVTESRLIAAAALREAASEFSNAATAGVEPVLNHLAAKLLFDRARRLYGPIDNEPTRAALGGGDHE